MKLLLPLSIIVMVTAFACSNDNEEDLMEGTVCETENMSYAADIKPILEDNCYSCHSNESTYQGAFPFEDFEDLTSIVNDGRLVGSINHDQGYAKMPVFSSKLDSCTIEKIEAWIDDGAMDN